MGLDWPFISPPRITTPSRESSAREGEYSDWTGCELGSLQAPHDSAQHDECALQNRNAADTMWGLHRVNAAYIRRAFFNQLSADVLVAGNLTAFSNAAIAPALLLSSISMLPKTTQH